MPITLSVESWWISKYFMFQTLFFRRILLFMTDPELTIGLQVLSPSWEEVAKKLLLQLDLSKLK